ncbi:MAG: hypothetical protein ACRYFR_04535 [Janthinobacterium lividum]
MAFTVFLCFAWPPPLPAAGGPRPAGAPADTLRRQHLEEEELAATRTAYNAAQLPVYSAGGDGQHCSRIGSEGPL